MSASFPPIPLPRTYIHPPAGTAHRSHNKCFMSLYEARIFTTGHHIHSSDSNDIDKLPFYDTDDKVSVNLRLMTPRIVLCDIMRQQATAHPLRPSRRTYSLTRTCSVQYSAFVFERSLRVTRRKYNAKKSRRRARVRRCTRDDAAGRGPVRAARLHGRVAGSPLSRRAQLGDACLRSALRRNYRRLNFNI